MFRKSKYINIIPQIDLYMIMVPVPKKKVINDLSRSNGHLL